jgi:hypothetical protein
MPREQDAVGRLDRTVIASVDPRETFLLSHIEPSHSWILGLCVESDGSVVGPGLDKCGVVGESLCPDPASVTPNE